MCSQWEQDNTDQSRVSDMFKEKFSKVSSVAMWGYERHQECWLLYMLTSSQSLSLSSKAWIKSNTPCLLYWSWKPEDRIYFLPQVLANSAPHKTWNIKESPSMKRVMQKGLEDGFLIKINFWYFCILPECLPAFLSFPPRKQYHITNNVFKEKKGRWEKIQQKPMLYKHLKITYHVCGLLISKKKWDEKGGFTYFSLRIFLFFVMLDIHFQLLWGCYSI